MLAYFFPLTECFHESLFNFTPSDEIEDEKGLLFRESRGDQLVEVISLREHPHVVGEAGVLGEHEEKLAPCPVLKRVSSGMRC